MLRDQRGQRMHTTKLNGDYTHTNTHEKLRSLRKTDIDNSTV